MRNFVSRALFVALFLGLGCTTLLAQTGDQLTSKSGETLNIKWATTSAPVITQDTEGKKFKLRSKDNNINIVFVDAAAKAEFLSAIAARGSYNPGTAENPNPQSREDFVLAELETLFSDWIRHARVKVAVEDAARTVDDSDLPKHRSNAKPPTP